MTDAPNVRRHPVFPVARAIGWLWALVAGGLALLLLVEAVTTRGRIFAIASLAAALLPLAITLAVEHRSSRWSLASVALAAGLVVPVIGLCITAPNGNTPGAARAFHAWPDGQDRFARHALGNLLPEVDELMLGFTLVPAIDPLLSQPEAGRLKQCTAATYAELDANEGFRALGSVLPLAYAELCGTSPGPAADHVFVYLPATLDRLRPAPVLVFFHGSGGNLKGYWWVLAQVAESMGAVLVAPSFGLGNWRLPQSAERFDNSVRIAQRFARVDAQDIHVAGLSNGGLAVSQVLATRAERLRSVIFISPVFDVSVLRGTKIPAGLPVLAFSGVFDNRVPIDYVRENAARLRAHGAAVTLSEFDADHFLIFSHRTRLVPDLGKWPQTHSDSRSP